MAKSKHRQRKTKSPQDEAFHILEPSFKRLGFTAADRLKWLLEFANTDLDSLYAEQKAALGYDLGALIWLRELERSKADFFRTTGRSPTSSELPNVQIWIGPLTEGLLRDAHSDLTKGLKQLFSDEGESAGTWQMPLPKTLVLKRNTPLDAKRCQLNLCVQNTPTSPSPSKQDILYAFTEVIGQGQHLLRACAECRKPFMPVRRQEYCSPACSQKARDRRRKKK